MPSAGEQALADVEDDLYGSPDDFVRRRDEAARAAKRQGDQDLADAIKALRKPTAAAGALNAFARSDPSAVEAVLDLGGRLRTAVASGDGDDIRALTRERSRSVADATAQVRRHAAERGEPLSEAVAAQIAQTLRAATASEEDGQLVRRGVLSAALNDTGLETLAAPAAGRPSAARPSGASSADGGKIDQRLRDAEARVERSSESLERVQAQLDDATATRRALESERDELRTRMDEVDRRLRQARQAEADIAAALDEAESELRAARAALRKAAPDDR